MAEKNKTVKFRCPECGHHELEEIQIDITTTSVIDVLNVDGDFDYDSHPTLEDGEIERYQCSKCGFILQTKSGENISEPLELIEWLKENCNQEKF